MVISDKKKNAIYLMTGIYLEIKELKKINSAEDNEIEKKLVEYRKNHGIDESDICNSQYIPNADIREKEIGPVFVNKERLQREKNIKDMEKEITKIFIESFGLENPVMNDIFLFRKISLALEKGLVKKEDLEKINS